MTGYIQVMTTVNNQADADTIAGAAVSERLAACVQVIGPISSTYWWQGSLESADEWLCLIKTAPTSIRRWRASSTKCTPTMYRRFWPCP